LINPISSKLARRMVLHSQMLDGRTDVKEGKEGIAQTVERLGYVQIDTISVIERAHHHTLWTRVPGYKQKHLHEALAKERTLFEYWGHAASYLPMGDYRFYIPMMRGFLDPKEAWFKGWGEKYGSYLEPVKKRIREEGPLAARDFENPGDRGKGPWWDWKPAKAALELLFWRGELMIRERQGFERVYDLTERVLPAGVDTRMPDPGELGRFIIRRALGALGVASEREIRDYIRIGDKETVTRALKEMLAAGEIVPLNIEGQNGMAHALASVLEETSCFRAAAPRVYLLSPFDNLVISRYRLKQRFGFDYCLECYIPKHKRNHGYFVLPILFGENIVGRLDPKADRPNRKLIVRQLVLESGFDDLERLVPELKRTLRNFARFNGCKKVVLEKIEPGRIAASLKKALE
jgi:uncharacterized protein YcaQ